MALSKKENEMKATAKEIFKGWYGYSRGVRSGVRVQEPQDLGSSLGRIALAAVHAAHSGCYAALQPPRRNMKGIMHPRMHAAINARWAQVKEEGASYVSYRRGDIFLWGCEEYFEDRPSPARLLKLSIRNSWVNDHHARGGQ